MPGSARVTDPKQWTCPLCPKSFTTKASKQNHVILIHQNSGRYRCSHCYRTFQERCSFDAHLRSHTGERPFGCEICQARFNRKSALNLHHLNVHAEKKYECETCGKKYGSKRSRNKHLIAHLPLSFRCEFCERGFPSSYRLRIHHLDRHAEKKFRCDSCGKLFGRRCGLQRHSVCHASERFKCELCSRSYQHKRHLKRHQKRHHSATQQNSSAPRYQVRGNDQEKYRVKGVPANDRDGSRSASYSLRTRGETPNYREFEDDFESEERSDSRSSENSESDHQDSDDESSGPDEATRGDDEREQNGNRFRDNEWRSRKVNAKNDRPTRGSPMRTEREPDSDSQIGNDANMSEAAYVSRDRTPGASPAILLRPDKPSPPESSTICRANLKVVFGVEYRAPD